MQSLVYHDASNNITSTLISTGNDIIFFVHVLVLTYIEVFCLVTVVCVCECVCVSVCVCECVCVSVCV